MEVYDTINLQEKERNALMSMSVPATTEDAISSVIIQTACTSAGVCRDMCLGQI